MVAMSLVIAATLIVVPIGRTPKASAAGPAVYSGSIQRSQIVN